MSKHIKPPWEVHSDHDITGYPCFYIHGLAGDDKRDESSLSATVHVIAAAPDMLEMLERCELWLGAHPDGKAMQSAVRAVILKARGE